MIQDQIQDQIQVQIQDQTIVYNLNPWDLAEIVWIPTNVKKECFVAQV